MKLIAAVVVLVGAVMFVVAQYRSSVPEQVDRNAGQRAQRPPGPEGAQAGQSERPEPGRLLNRPDRESLRAEMTERLGLSKEQLAKLEEIDKQFEGKRGPEAWGGRAEAMAGILTPEQQTKFQEMHGEMRERFQERMKQRMMERASVLPEGEQELFLKKLEQRMEEGPSRWGGRGGQMGPPPPDAPPPDGQ